MTNHKGLTLLEAVIAMALFFVVVLALSGLAVTASKGAAASKHLTTAATLAQDTLEQVRSTGYDAGLTAPLETMEAYDAISDFPCINASSEWSPTVPFQVYKP